LILFCKHNAPFTKGTNGDHADPNNKFYVSLVNLDMGLKQSDMFNMSYVVAGPIAAPNGRYAASLSASRASLKPEPRSVCRNTTP
jgi:hypothetical protein